MVRVLRVLKKLVLADIVGADGSNQSSCPEAQDSLARLVPYYRQILPVFNIFKIAISIWVTQLIIISKRTKISVALS